MQNDWLIWVSETEAIDRWDNAVFSCCASAGLNRSQFSAGWNTIKYLCNTPLEMPLTADDLSGFSPSDLQSWPCSCRTSWAILAWQSRVVLAVLALLCSLLQVAERFAACAEVSEQVAVFLVGDRGALGADVDRPRCAVVIPWDREGRERAGVLSWGMNYHLNIWLYVF